MRGRPVLALLCAWQLAMVGPAIAEPPGFRIDIEAGPLTASLHDLARQTGIDLLFDSDLVRGTQAPAIGGQLTTEDALAQLLSQSEFVVRRAASGAWIVEQPDTSPLAQQDAAVNQILVIGTLTQNADIRRTENDVQPYNVSTKADIVNSHRDNIEQYLNGRVTSNTQIGDPFYAANGDTSSKIDLRGLGANNTVVLVDGRRMPVILDQGVGFDQPDLNSIPFHAIERIETLTGAAGGIYGFGALGGVVNVILDRDSRGLDIYLSQGISSRGDAHRQSVEASFGHTSDDGATDFSMFAALSKSDPLLAGQRDFMSRDRSEVFRILPDRYLSSSLYFGNSVTVRDIAGSNLVFKPEFGGKELPSRYTYLPVGFSGPASGLTALLTSNAGQVDFSLSKGEAESDLESRPQSSAVLMNLRHTFDAGLEVYGDALVLRSQGESHVRTLAGANGYGIIGPDSPANPFTNYVEVIFPIEGIDRAANKRFETTRYTAGLVADLPFDWRGAVEAGVGSSRFTAEVSSQFDVTGGFIILFGDPTDLDTNPFGDWDAFQRSIALDPQRFAARNAYRTEFGNQSLRLAGPVFETGAGPTTLTLLGERRWEHQPAYSYSVTNESGGSTSMSESPVLPLTATTNSVYAELHSPVFDGEYSSGWLLRGLEIQLAVRREDQDIKMGLYGPGPGSQRIEFAGTAYTAGAKVSPTSWLMLRGSYSTGKQPLPLFLMINAEDEMTTLAIAGDPKRPGSSLGDDGAYLWRQGNPSDLDLIEANTTYLGIVLTPYGVDGPSLAIDYSKIHKENEIRPVFAGEVMLREDEWPDRVARAPLTDEDRANGYTAGRVIMIDTRDMNAFGRKVEAYDVRAEWPTTYLGGRLRLYADATYHKRNTHTQLFEADVQEAGYRQTPLKWRANGGFDWSSGDLTIGANVQYFGSYYISTPGAFDADHVELQGSDRVRSQTYVDLHATWRLPFNDIGPIREAMLEFGAINVLDEAPARETADPISGGPGYSLYGDPRQRRFEVTLSSHF